jgi:hypothetical protein
MMRGEIWLTNSGDKVIVVCKVFDMREWSLLYTSERSREVIGRRRKCVDFEFFKTIRGKICKELVLLRGNERVCNREEEKVSVPSIERRELHLDCERAGQHVFSSHQGSLGRFAAELIQRDDVGDSRLTS